MASGSPLNVQGSPTQDEACTPAVVSVPLPQPVRHDGAAPGPFSGWIVAGPGVYVNPVELVAELRVELEQERRRRRDAEAAAFEAELETGVWDWPWEGR